jgi:hypothetical protein
VLFYFQSQAYTYDFSPRSEAQVSKQASRWSLAQWMEQKGKIQWMDIWLHSNKASPSFYEMYLGGDHSAYDRATVTTLPGALADDEFSSTSGHFGFFIAWFGLYGKYEDSDDEDRVTWDALAQLRLLGTSDQGSNFTVFYGLKNNEMVGASGADQVQNQQFGGALTLYLLNAWAAQARYEHLISATSDLGLEVDGYRFEASTWLEWGALRLYGTWFHEPREETNAAGILTTTRREGFNVGLRVYLDFKK